VYLILQKNIWNQTINLQHIYRIKVLAQELIIISS
jgi:hypothetical protein